MIKKQSQGSPIKNRSQRKPPFPSWLDSAVFYQIYPQSFQDSNDDGIGDIRGIIHRLDYIADLGCNAIWLSPLFESPFRDAGYDITNFYKIASRYGTEKDLCRLFVEAKKRGIRVILDLVAGHTSNEHPWFVKSASPRKSSYSERYVWTSSTWDADAPAHFISGGSERDGRYLPNFFYFQPALNYGYSRLKKNEPWRLLPTDPQVKAVRNELKNIMRHWLSRGCDGFRVDMAASLIKDDVHGRGIRSLWSEYRTWLESNYPDAVLVSEWSNPKAAIGAGFHIDFLLSFGEPAYQRLCLNHTKVLKPKESARCYFHRSGTGNVELFLHNYTSHYLHTKNKGFIALPTGNHDLVRFIHNRTSLEQKVFHAMLLTMPGVPFIYYGDEIGLPFNSKVLSKEGGYSRTGTRTPMQWTKGKNAGFSKAPKELLYLPVDSSQKRVSVESQLLDPTSLLNHVRRLLRLRKEHPALGNKGQFRSVYSNKKSPLFMYLRSHQKYKFLIAINPSQRAEVAPYSVDKLETIYVHHISIKTNRVHANPFSFGIWRFIQS